MDDRKKDLSEETVNSIVQEALQQKEAPGDALPREEQETAAPVQAGEAPAETAGEETPAKEPPKPEEEPPRPAKAPEEPPKKGGLARLLKNEKLRRGGMATLMSVVFIAIVVVINILVGLLSDRFPSMNIDLTAQGLNTLSEQAEKIAKEVDNDTVIYLIGAEDSYRKDRLFSSYGLSYSQVANLAERLREANPKISVEFVDPDENPAFISQYSEENLSSGSVLVHTEKRDKALHVTDLFDIAANSSTGAYDVYTKADSALASALEIVNLDKVPVLTVATGHDEILDSSSLGSFTALMEDQNFEVREINFLTDEIPEDTQILMIPTPRTDYTEEEVSKLRAFLDNDTRDEQFMVLVTCHATQGELPRLSSFLEEWGIRVEQGAVAESDASRMVAGNPSYVLVDAVQEKLLMDNSYGNLVSAASSPLTILFAANGDVATEPLWKSSDSAFVVTQDMTELPEAPETQSYTVAAIAAQYKQVGKSYLRRSVVVFGSSYVFSGSFINASAYSDRQYLTDLLQYCTDTDASAVSVRTRQVQTNVIDVSASAGTIQLLGMGVFTIGIPLAILIAGLAIFLKRRHL